MYTNFWKTFSLSSVGAEYRYNLSVNILKLSETGKLFQMKNTWWTNEKKDCKDDENEDNASLGIQEVRGIFYTLFLGLLAAYILGIIEFLMHCHSRASEEKVSIEVDVCILKFEILLLFANAFSCVLKRF